MQAEPTRYKDILFRSRLEARWASFFDLLGWKWEYEPDLNIKGWIPDFILIGKEEDVLVEVKPFIELEQWKDQRKKIAIALRDSKIPEHISDILLAGSCLKYEAQQVAIGYLMERGFGTGSLAIVRGYPGDFGFYSADNSWHCRITGLYDGNAHTSLSSNEDVESLWRDSLSFGQWKSPEVTDAMSVLDREGFSPRKCFNGKVYHFVIKYKRKIISIYPPKFKVNGHKNHSFETVECGSLNAAIAFIKEVVK